MLQWWMKAIDAEEAWKITNGEGVKVAILDTGVCNHPDLSVVCAKDFTGSKTGSVDQTGHGTHVAGLVAGKNRNGQAGGVAPGCSLMCGKVIGDYGKGSFEAIERGIVWAMSMGADVINMSIGRPLKPPDYVAKAIESATKNGIVIVASAGTEPCWPAAYEEVVAVCAVNRKGMAAAQIKGSVKPFLYAPGTQMNSTHLNEGYKKLSGTSMAAPIVSGAAALYIAKERKKGRNPSSQEVKQALFQCSIWKGKEKNKDNLPAIINLEQLMN